MLLIVILSSGFALSPSFARESFSFTFPFSISSSAFLLEQCPELAIIFWRRSILVNFKKAGLYLYLWNTGATCLLAGNRTIIFLVGRSRLSVFAVDSVVDDFYETSLSNGGQFSNDELDELKRIKDCPSFLVRSEMFDRIRPYALPFFEKESLKSRRGLIEDD